MGGFIVVGIAAALMYFIISRFRASQNSRQHDKRMRSLSHRQHVFAGTFGSRRNTCALA